MLGIPSRSFGRLLKTRVVGSLTDEVVRGERVRLRASLLFICTCSRSHIIFGRDRVVPLCSSCVCAPRAARSLCVSVHGPLCSRSSKVSSLWCFGLCSKHHLFFSSTFLYFFALAFLPFLTFFTFLTFSISTNARPGQGRNHHRCLFWQVFDSLLCRFICRRP